MQNQWIVIVAFAAVAILVLGIRALISKDKTQRTASLVAVAVLALTAALSMATLTSQTSTAIGIVLAALCLVLPTAAYVLTVMMINRSNRNAEAERYFEDVILGISDVPDTVVEADESVAEEGLTAAVQQSNSAKQKPSDAAAAEEAEEVAVATKPEKKSKRRRFGEGKKRAEKAAEKEAAALLAEEADQLKKEEAAEEEAVKTADQSKAAASTTEYAPQPKREIETPPRQVAEAPVVAAVAATREALREEPKAPVARLVERPVTAAEEAAQTEAPQLSETKTAEPAITEAPPRRQVEQPSTTFAQKEQTAFAEMPTEVELGSVAHEEEPEVAVAQVVEETVIEETFVIPQSERRDSAEVFVDQESDDIYKALRAMVDRNTAALTRPQESMSQGNKTMPFSTVKDALAEQYAQADTTEATMPAEQHSEVEQDAAVQAVEAEAAPAEKAPEAVAASSDLIAETDTMPTEQAIAAEAVINEQVFEVDAVLAEQVVAAESAPVEQVVAAESASVEQPEAAEPTMPVEQAVDTASAQVELVSGVDSTPPEQPPAVEPATSEHYTVIANYEPATSGATIKEVFLNEQPEPAVPANVQPIAVPEAVVEEAAVEEAAQETDKQAAVMREADVQKTVAQEVAARPVTQPEATEKDAAQPATHSAPHKVEEQPVIKQAEVVPSTERVTPQPEVVQQHEPRPVVQQAETRPASPYAESQPDTQEVETHSVIVQTDPVAQLEISFDKVDTPDSTSDNALSPTPAVQVKSGVDKTSDVDLSYQIKAQAFEKKKLYGIAARLYEESAYRTSNSAHTQSALVSAMKCYLKDGRLIDAKAIASGLEGQINTLSEEAATAVKTILQMPM